MDCQCHSARIGRLHHVGDRLNRRFNIGGQRCGQGGANRAARWIADARGGERIQAERTRAGIFQLEGDAHGITDGGGGFIRGGRLAEHHLAACDIDRGRWRQDEIAPAAICAVNFDVRRVRTC